MDGDTVVMVTKEGERVVVPKELLSMSGLLRDCDPWKEIDIPEVAKPELELILEYFEYHCYMAPPPIKKPIPTDKIEDAVSVPWDAEFITRLEENQLIDLTMASNYLDISCIFDLCCGTIASLFKGKTIDELRAKYNIQEEYTPEIEERILKENPWITGDEERVLNLR